MYSHTAIVARSMGIPALVEAGEGLTEDWDGHWAVLDGFAGCLYIDPDPDTCLSAPISMVRMITGLSPIRSRICT